MSDHTETERLGGNREHTVTRGAKPRSLARAALPGSAYNVQLAQYGVIELA